MIVLQGHFNSISLSLISENLHVGDEKMRGQKRPVTKRAGRRESKSETKNTKLRSNQKVTKVTKSAEDTRGANTADLTKREGKILT